MRRERERKREQQHTATDDSSSRVWQSNNTPLRRSSATFVRGLWLDEADAPSSLDEAPSSPAGRPRGHLSSTRGGGLHHRHPPTWTDWDGLTSATEARRATRSTASPRRRAPVAVAEEANGWQRHRHLHRHLHHHRLHRNSTMMKKTKKKTNHRPVLQVVAECSSSCGPSSGVVAFRCGGGRQTRRGRLPMANVPQTCPRAMAGPERTKRCPSHS